VDNPKIPGAIWKKIVENPELCGRGIKYRECLPLQTDKIVDANNDAPIEGLYFVHDLRLIRVFTLSTVGCGIALVIALYTTKISDPSTGFTVGAFILAAIAVYLAFLSLVVSVSRKW
jgi:hypothetical protein